ncbi:MAG: transporter substrate-binding domain-containing protein, partial [Erysipelothrix sp.]|nr:transporter substrate-binding domain-containing protein [Erysipelothrix sp.]
ISTIKDLKGLDVGVETQSSGQIAIEKHPIIDDINELQKYTNISEALLALNAKTVDAIVVDVTFAG